MGAAIFNDVARLMYNLSDAKRHWKTYLSHIKLIPVASAATSVSAQPTDGSICFCIRHQNKIDYDKLMNTCIIQWGAST